MVILWSLWTYWNAFSHLQNTIVTKWTHVTLSIRVKFNHIINIEIMSFQNYNQIFLIKCWNILWLILQIVCLSFHLILSTFTKLLAFLVFLGGLPIENKCFKSYMLIIWLLYIVIKLWQNPSINGNVGSCFNLRGWDLLKIKIWVKTWM